MLNQSQLDQFNDKGYLVIENLIDEESLDAVKREYSHRMDDLYSNWHQQGLVKAPTQDMSFWDKLDQCYHGHFDWYQPFDISLPHADISEDTPMHFGPAIFDIVTHERILDLVEDLIGPEITSNPIQHVRIKPPRRVVPESEDRAHIIATDWHQDQGVTLEEADKTEFVTVWLAITDATIENGCLQVAPSKANELLPHCTKKQTAIADGFVDTQNGLPVPVGAGGAVIFHPLTPHASLDNKTDGYRWSFDLRYNVSGQPTGRSHFPDFVARSRSNPQSELRDWREWKTMWEETRTRLSTTPHIEQHRWGSTGQYCA